MNVRLTKPRPELADALDSRAINPLPYNSPGHLTAELRAEGSSALDDQQRCFVVEGELFDPVKTSAKCVSSELPRGIADSKPDGFRWRAVEKRQLAEVGVFGNDDVAGSLGEFPDNLIIG